MNIPGKILVVDNRESDVERLVSEFKDKGENIFYSNIRVDKQHFDNLRLLILDLYLTEDDNLENSVSIIAAIVKEASEKNKFFMSAIWSQKVTNENKQDVRKEFLQLYFDIVGEEYPGILLDPLSKKELNYRRLVTYIYHQIGKYPELLIFYEFEKILLHSSDNVINEIYDIGNWDKIVKELNEEYDSESINRQVLDIYLDIIKRNMYTNNIIRNSILELLQKKKTETDEESFRKLYNKKYYYDINKREQIGTGDILYNGTNKKYYIIINPECDLTQNKHTYLKLLEASRIEHSDLYKKEFVIKFGKTHTIIEKGSIIPKRVIDSILKGGLKNNYFVIKYLFDKNNNEYYHLMLDFNNVTHIKKTIWMPEIPKYKRIGRIETVLCDSIKQLYSAHCSRMGTMSIPKDISTSIIKDLEPEYKI